ncbi:MAG TPA: SDR family oxidoreductase [Opitutaceae bacterium]|nr:SDR family oxidoreductase [Opitutaceae bacterium]
MGSSRAPRSTSTAASTCADRGDAGRFGGKVVWITGASSGIGEQLALGFARAGARLVLSSRRRDELERVRLACERAAEHLVLPLDLARSETFAPATASVLARFGHVDIVLNNGGVSQRGLAIETAPEVERALMEVNYFGPVALTKAVLPAMLSRRAGHVVVVSSVMGYVGTPGRSTYAAAKHALHGYFDCLRTEVWRHGIRVTLACPGYVQTAVSDNALGPDGRKHGRTDRTHVGSMPADACAAAIMRGIARGREEVYVGREAAAIYIRRFAPWIYSQLARRMKSSVRP